MPLSKQNKIYVKEIIDQEGFDYAFADYTDFKEIEDLKFPELRLVFLKAREDLRKYIGWPK